MSTWVVEQLLFIMALLRAFNQAAAIAIARSNEECKKISFFSLCAMFSWNEGAQWIHGGVPWNKNFGERKWKKMINVYRCDFIVFWSLPFRAFFRCARNRIWWWWLYFASITFRRSELVAIPSLKAKPKKKRENSLHWQMPRRRWQQTPSSQWCHRIS